MSQTISTNGNINFLYAYRLDRKNVPVGHCMPVNLSKELIEDFKDLIFSAIKAMNLTGPSNVDLIIDKNNKIFVLEIGARIGATCLPN